MCWKLLILTAFAVSARHIDRDVLVDQPDDQRRENGPTHEGNVRQMHKHGSELGEAGEVSFEHHRRPHSSGSHHQSYIQSNDNINPQYEDFSQVRGQGYGQGHVEPRHINTHAYHNHAQRPDKFDSIRPTDEFDRENHREHEVDPRIQINENSKLISEMNHRIHQQMYQSMGKFDQRQEETYAKTDLGIQNQNQGYVSRDGAHTDNQNNRQPDTKQQNTQFVDQQSFNYNQNTQDNTRPADETQNVNTKPYGTHYDRDPQRNGNQGFVKTNPSQQNTHRDDPATQHGSGYGNGEKTNESGRTDRNPDRKHDREQTGEDLGHVDGGSRNKMPANNGTLEITTETANSTVIVGTPNRAAFSGEKCPTGKIKVNDICVDKD